MDAVALVVALVALLASVGCFLLLLDAGRKVGARQRHPTAVTPPEEPPL